MGIGAFFVRLFSGAVIPAVTGVYLVAYMLLQYSGLFAAPPENIMRVLHRWPALAGAGMFCLSGILRFLFYGLKKDSDAASCSGVFLSRLTCLGLFFIGLGIIVSSLTRFEGSVILNEGQALMLQDESYDSGSLYKSKFARQPHGLIFVNEIGPFISDSGKPLLKHTANMLFRKDERSFHDEIRLSSLFPSFVGTFIYCIRDVGYSPRFILFDSKGEVIEDLYAVMRLFPAGTEAFFRFEVIPHTFYLRYYPDGVSIQDRPEPSGGKQAALFKVRIARNIELIADFYVSPGGPIGVDSLALTLGDVKRWIEIRVIRDPGLYILIPGIVLVSLGLVCYVLRRYGLIR